MQPRDYTIGEASNLVGLSEKTLLRAIRSGELPCLKINARVYRLMPVDLSVWYLSRRSVPCPQVVITADCAALLKR